MTYRLLALHMCIFVGAISHQGAKFARAIAPVKGNFLSRKLLYESINFLSSRALIWCKVCKNLSNGSKVIYILENIYNFVFTLTFEAVGSAAIEKQKGIFWA